MPDARVLHALADAADIDLKLPTVAVTRTELGRFPLAANRLAGPWVAPAPAPRPAPPGQAALATWPELLDGGRMSDGEPNLAGTARPARAMLSAATARSVGVVAGAKVTVSTERGSLTVPAVIAEVADGVVWLPTNARGSSVRSALGANAGDLVKLSGQ